MFKKVIRAAQHDSKSRPPRHKDKPQPPPRRLSHLLEDLPDVSDVAIPKTSASKSSRNSRTSRTSTRDHVPLRRRSSSLSALDDLRLPQVDDPHAGRRSLGADSRRRRGSNAPPSERFDFSFADAPAPQSTRHSRSSSRSGQHSERQSLRDDRSDSYARSESYPRSSSDGSERSERSSRGSQSLPSSPRPSRERRRSSTRHGGIKKAPQLSMQELAEMYEHKLSLAEKMIEAREYRIRQLEMSELERAGF
eukprot:m.28999 g.28999  ORF g.28999 m.28999 type:complete len:250 (+) comp5035_c1_seq1:128-877(+)